MKITVLPDAQLSERIRQVCSRFLFFEMCAHVTWVNIIAAMQTVQQKLSHEYFENRLIGKRQAYVSVHSAVYGFDDRIVNRMIITKQIADAADKQQRFAGVCYGHMPAIAAAAVAGVENGVNRTMQNAREIGHQGNVGQRFSALSVGNGLRAHIQPLAQLCLCHLRCFAKALNKPADSRKIKVHADSSF